jgi:hypothetical protein
MSKFFETKYKVQRTCTLNTKPTNYFWNLFFFPLGWSWSKSTFTEVTIGLLYQPRMMMDDNECRAYGGVLCKENRSTRRKPAPVPLCPPQIPHNLTRARIWVAEVGIRRLTACSVIDLMTFYQQNRLYTVEGEAGENVKIKCRDLFTFPKFTSRYWGKTT